METLFSQLFFSSLLRRMPVSRADENHELTAVSCELLCEGDLVRRFLELTVIQGLVFILYCILLIYCSLALNDVIVFEWFTFGIGWGITTLVFQGLHCVAYIFYKTRVRADSRNREKPIYLVGTPVLREIQMAVLVSTFSFTTVITLIMKFLAFQGTGKVAYTTQVPFIWLISGLAMFSLSSLFCALFAQSFPVTNMRHILVYIKTTRKNLEH